jgi:hypothetical protein
MHQTILKLSMEGRTQLKTQVRASESSLREQQWKKIDHSWEML